MGPAAGPFFAILKLRSTVHPHKAQIDAQLNCRTAPFGIGIISPHIYDMAMVPGSRGFMKPLVALVDLDAFYVAVERDLNPCMLVDKPVLVVQYNPFENSSPEESAPSGSGSGSVGSSCTFGVRTLPFDSNRIISDHNNNGSAIAVSYEARALGVKRIMRAIEARKVAAAAGQELVVVQVPTANGKSDMEIYRRYGRKVVDILRAALPGCPVEKSSVDEIYVELMTPFLKTFIANVGGVDECIRIAGATHIAGSGIGDDAAAKITAAEMRMGFAGHGAKTDAELRAQLNQSSFWTPPTADDTNSDSPSTYALFAAACAAVAQAREKVSVAFEGRLTCTAGLGISKITAKLAGGLHKPNQQTGVYPTTASISRFMRDVPIEKLRGLGGMLGQHLIAHFPTAGLLADAPTQRVVDLIQNAKWAKPHETASRVMKLAKGIDDEAVKERTRASSISTGKTFRGSHGSSTGPLRTFADVATVCDALCRELEVRLEERRSDTGDVPTVMTISLSTLDGKGGSRSGQWPLGAGSSASNSSALAQSLLKRWAKEVGANESNLGITGLFVAANELQSAGVHRQRTLDDHLKNMPPPAETTTKPALDAAPPTVATPSSPTRPQPVPWICIACTLENMPSASRCEACGTLRGGSLPPASTLALHKRPAAKSLSSILGGGGKEKKQAKLRR